VIAFIRRFDHRLWILAGGWVASAVGFSLAIPFMALYFHDKLGLSLTFIGLYFGVAAVVRAITQAMGGELSDKVGRYWLMVLAQLFRTFSFLGLAAAIYYSLGFWVIGALVILNSIFGAIFQPVANATVADLTGKADRAEGYAIVRVAGNFGWALGPAVGGYLAEGSYAILFIISGCMTLISSSIIALFLKGIKSTSKNNEEPFKFRDILSIRKDRLFFRHTVLLFFLYLAFAQVIAPFSLYVVDLVGLSKSQLGILFTLNGLLVAILQIPVTRMLKPLRLTIQMALGLLILSTAFVIVGFAGTFIVFLITMVIMTLGEVFHSPPALSLTANLAPEGRTGRYMGIYGFAVVAGWSMGPMLGGTLLDMTAPHYSIMWIIIAGLALATGTGYYLLSRRMPLAKDTDREETI